MVGETLSALLMRLCLWLDVELRISRVLVFGNVWFEH